MTALGLIARLLGRRAPLWVRFLRTGGAIVMATAVLAALLLARLQARVLFDPSPVLMAGGGAVSPDITCEDVSLRAANQETIDGWYFPHAKARGTLLFLRSGAANMSFDQEPVRFFHELGLNVFIFDYRGFGHSEGTPSEASTYADAQSAWDYLIYERGIDPGAIVLYGRSLGAAVALNLARSVAPAGVVVEAGYRSAAVGLSSPWLRSLGGIWPAYPAGRYIKAIHCPVLIVHSPSDTVVAYEEGQRLYAAANEPKTFLEVRGLHGDSIFASRQAYREALQVFLGAWLGGDSTAPATGAR